MFETEGCDFPLGLVCLKDGWGLVRGRPSPRRPGPPARPARSRPQRGGGLMASPPPAAHLTPEAALAPALVLADRVCSSPDNTTEALFPEKL